MVGDDDLRCPASGAHLVRQGAVLRTDDGAHEYPIVDGVPILIAPEHSVFTPGDPPRPPGRLRRLAARLPRDTANVGTAPLVARLRELLPERPRVLVVGGGTLGEGMAPLLDDPSVDATETDVWLGPRTNLLCDGHDLPFADATFDAVVCQAVLEHVADPPRVVSEIHRVLRPRGLVYSDIPLMQQVHGGAHDFTRYTHVGHLRLYRYFDELESGVTGGPGMALGWSINYFMLALAGRSRTLRGLAERLASLLFFWLKYVDAAIGDRPGSLDAASGIYLLAARREDPLSDRDIVRRYRGTRSMHDVNAV
jgi:SAM-dependent methyltransferase